MIMAPPENKGPAIPSTNFSIGHSSIINEYGQLIGEYWRLDDELWLSKFDDDETFLTSNEEINCDFVPTNENIVDLEKPAEYAVLEQPAEYAVPEQPAEYAVLEQPADYVVLEQPAAYVVLEQPAEYVDNSVCDRGMASVKEKSCFLKDSSQNQSHTPSPVSVLPRSLGSQIECHQPTKHNISGGLQVFDTTIPTRDHSEAFQSESSGSEYSMESYLSDETEEYFPSKLVRTRKISDLLHIDSDPAVKKCTHCETTETPQWRTGPMGRKTLCNACGVQYKHGRLFPNYRPIKSPTFDPSLHSNLPKKVQKMRMGSTSERGPNSIPGAKKLVDMRMGNSSERGPNLIPIPKKVEEMRTGHRSERDPNPTHKPKKVEEMRVGNSSEMAQRLTSEFSRVKEMKLGNNNERDQNHAHRAQNFQDFREKASNVLQSESRERDRNFNSNLILKRKLATMVIKKCLHCESTETPQWREGPMGRKTLCNACGVQYKAGRLFPEYRPLKSPTFNPLLHSHLPKKVQQMRMCKADKCAISGNNEKPA